MKEAVDVPIICAGRMDNPDMAIEAIQNGTTDMISLGRPLLADPDYVNKLRADETDMIRPCISCQEGCMGRIQEYSALNCAVNPRACRERATTIGPALEGKKVLIVGGGVAGLEAARVLSLKGHKPVVYEKSSKLGGNLLPGGVPDFKEDDIALAEWYERVLRSQNVPVYLNSEVNKDFVLKNDFHTVIIATGSKPKRFSLGDDSKVYTAAEVLMGEKDSGQKTVIIGGGLVGCETALWLKDQDKDVIIVEALEKILCVNGPLCHANSEMLEKLIPHKDIEVIASAKAAEFKEGKLALQTPDGDKNIECDSVILSIGYESDNQLYRDLEFDVPRIYNLGDSQNVANIMYAIWDAFEVANSIE